MSSSFLLESFLLAGGGIFLEGKFGSSIKNKYNTTPITPLILIATGFWSVTHGMKVGKGRKDAIENAKKDGEENVEDRYDLPNLYAQGTSKHVKVFNTIQRSHQHIFESFTQLAIASMAGAMEFPITAAASTLLYSVGRVALSNGYAAAEGDPTKRYSSSVAKYMWHGLLVSVMVGAASCVKAISKKKI